MLDAHARFLRADKNRKAALEGHTDDRGGREYNLALGQKRAEAVRRALSVLGVSDNQIEAVSYGKEKPAVPGMDESSFAKNRRAEISYR
jgi:peptidoglycan-associated lipoprotein